MGLYSSKSYFTTKPKGRKDTYALQKDLKNASFCQDKLLLLCLKHINPSPCTIYFRLNYIRNGLQMNYTPEHTSSFLCGFGSWCVPISDLLGFSVTAAVFVWDSQVQDGYKRKQSLQEAEGVSRKGSCSAPIGWDGKKSCDVVEELLKNSSDKAYGTEGELSVRSQPNLVCKTSQLS